MKQRVRYIKKDNKLISTVPLVAKTGARYMVYIDLETKTYMIRNIQTLRKYEGGEGINNMNVLKGRVKKHLAQLGVQFEKEKRFRTFGLVPRGTTQESFMAEQKLKKQLEEN